MSEGQPALTPEVAARWASEARMATGQNDHLWANRMSTALAELAREREARQEAERVLADAKRFHGNEFKDRQVAEGRVRELQGRLDVIAAEIEETGEFTPAAREALVGLPERQA